MVPVTEPPVAGKDHSNLLANRQGGSPNDPRPVEMEENGSMERDGPEENQVKTDEGYETDERYEAIKENLERASKAVKFHFWEGVSGKCDGKGTATFTKLRITETKNGHDKLIWDAARDYFKNPDKYHYVAVKELKEQLGSKPMSEITLEQKSAEQPPYFSRVKETNQFQAKVTASRTRKRKRPQAQQKYTLGGKKGLKESQGHVYVLGTLLAAQYLGVPFKMESEKESTDENPKNK